MSFLFEDTQFSAYSLEHLYPVLFYICLGILIIGYAKKKLNEKQQVNLGVALALLPFIAVFLRIYYEQHMGTFTIEEGLPLHLCRLLAVIAPFIMYSKNRTALAIFYFFTLTGTLNAIITPDLPEGFPNLSYFCYWLLHNGSVLVALYAVFVYGLRVTMKDMVHAIIASNILIVLMHGVNYLLGSNYLYTMHTPESATLLDHMGPWPWYLLSGELVMFLFMGIVYLPFLIFGKTSRA